MVKCFPEAILLATVFRILSSPVYCPVDVGSVVQIASLVNFFEELEFQQGSLKGICQNSKYKAPFILEDTFNRFIDLNFTSFSF